MAGDGAIVIATPEPNALATPTATVKVLGMQQGRTSMMAGGQPDPSPWRRVAMAGMTAVGHRPLHQCCPRAARSG